MKWNLEEIAREEERREIKVWVGYGKIRIGEQWWTRDEREIVLRGIRGTIRRQRQRLGEGLVGRGERQSR